jgi:hypothetical protein
VKPFATIDGTGNITKSKSPEVQSRQRLMFDIRQGMVWWCDSDILRQKNQQFFQQHQHLLLDTSAATDYLSLSYYHYYLESCYQLREILS